MRFRRRQRGIGLGKTRRHPFQLLEPNQRKLLAASDPCLAFREITETLQRQVLSLSQRLISSLMLFGSLVRHAPLPGERSRQTAYPRDQPVRPPFKQTTLTLATRPLA